MTNLKPWQVGEGPSQHRQASCLPSLVLESPSFLAITTAMVLRGRCQDAGASGLSRHFDLQNESLSFLERVLRADSQGQEPGQPCGSGRPMWTLLTF